MAPWTSRHSPPDLGQAPDEVKAAATHVTDPVDADGLAAAFRRFELI